MALVFKYVLLSYLFFAAFIHEACAERTEVRKDIAFIVRKPDKVKNIAVRFHVSVKELKHLNHPLHKNQMVYEGRQITIPVWMKLKDGQANNEYSVVNYKLDIDSLDGYIMEDFVCMADIESDTLRRIAIEKEMKRTDRDIAVINYTLDSIQALGMKTLSKPDIRKMQMARERHTGDFAIASQIGVLMKKKQDLNTEKDKIDLRRADYEYLVDNAPYMAKQHVAEATDAMDTQQDNSVIHLQEAGGDPNKPAR